MPDDFRKQMGCISKEACVNCGVYQANPHRFPGGAHDTCEKFTARVPMFQPGGSHDPFAGMRINGKVPGVGNLGQGTGMIAGSGAGSLGGAGVGAHGMPVRRVIDEDEREGTFAYTVTINKKETRPGLVEETIDKDAYDDFMRGL
jgi:hypothetical protein